MTTALLESKELIQRYLREAPGQLSSFSFTNIFTWQEFFQFELEVINGNLCVFARHEAGTFLYLPPLGKDVSAKTIEACFERMDKVNRHKGVSRVENVHAHQLPLFLPAEEFSHYNKGYEYCYYREDLAGLTGNAYKSKRSSYNHFVKNYKFKFLPYEDSMLEDCAALYREWARGRRPAYADNAVALQMLEENAGVHQLALRHYRELGLTGRVVTVDGREAPRGSKIRAYTFGYPLNENIFCVLFETADLSFGGLGVFIFREFCRDAALTPYKFINVMDDFELRNIQRVKDSFRPAVLFPSYTVTRK
ncbi:MAG: hypothetical protein A2Y05_01965 [Omnitrophica WOR_2 bacterium GWA2_53_43]|nr:MAG: hypothetical protein A2Y05_01965 [Omnitrophica WOR_2 bacterium GWA2_53_43]